ncbi:MAG: alpha-amylase family glycosyl hydrolase, partial [Ruminococcus sp.]
MKKQTLSVILCLSMLLSVVSVCFTANAVTVDRESTKANVDQSTTGVSKITSADDFSWDNATVYFLLTDRFKNGNTSNDHSYGRATDANGSPLSGWNTAPGTFHGGDFAGITQEIESGYFDDLGINAIWLSAPYEQIHGYVDSGVGFAHYSYHGYYVLDYTETDANFGTKEEFQTLV